MNTQISFHRILYVGIGIIAAVAIILTLLITPTSTLPQSYISSVWKIIIAHLLIIAGLVWSIKVFKPGNEKKELQIIAGIALLITGAFLLDYAIVFHTRPEQPPTVSFWLFIASGLDFVIGLLILIARFLPKKIRTNNFIPHLHNRQLHENKKAPTQC